MIKLFRISLFIGLSHFCTAQVYSGPKQLGSFHIDRNTSTNLLFKELGHTGRKENVYCYRTSDRKAFLRFEPIHTEMEHVGYVFLSDFPNCKRVPISISNDFRKWETGEGIGLGSSETQVLKVYGTPSAKKKLDLSDSNRVSGHIIRGYRPGDKLPHLADYALFYSGNSDDLSAAEFGIRDGRVVWIWLSQNE